MQMSSIQSKNSNMNFGDLDARINTLRVAQAELSSGNIAGKSVFVRLSDGAVAFPVERKVAQTMVATELKQALLGEQTSTSK